MTIFLCKRRAALQVYVIACALKEKLQEHVGKVSFVSSEKMEITVKEARRAACDPWAITGT
jgi:hypothetical protein